ncbi:cysteine desulfurase family protein [Butyrivibrio sp.]|uniref:cysteine desulfurase family protein n=1 Tax=Butyrivibrio sp. TaxID=28121 RepID=UPI0025C038D3|nr:cysteine desulfurase family protein [Butyrivibrio sp.]MBQ7428202.1 cysteine desulfurase [Butyrivibrio sp.]MBQ9304220.1 cysteine desulfurase [Butyrivibrio sp.]
MIYLDNAATTKMDSQVLEAMLPYLSESYLNPSAFYQGAVKIRMQVEGARRNIAEKLGVPSDTIFFTSGGTESDNWAIRLAAHLQCEKGKHIITSAIEHPAVLNTFKYLQDNGYDVTYVGVDRSGRIDLTQLKEAIREDTVLISIMHANNELGTIEPIEEIGRIAHEKGILFHTDAVQTFGHIPIDVEACNIDLMSVSGHKLYGPKGIGFLYIRDRRSFGRLLFGGSQEKGLRPGTENVSGIIGLAKATEIAYERLEQDIEDISALRDLFISEIKKSIPDVCINGNDNHHLPGTVNVTFPNISGEALLIALDQSGICASAGSACSAGAIEPSHVLIACGLTPDEAGRTLRFSIGRNNTQEEILKTISALKTICHV